MSVILTNLEPYTYYTFRVQACTTGGCLASEGAVVPTLPAAPEMQGPPNVTAISSTELHIEWEPPVFANGNFLSSSRMFHHYSTLSTQKI